MRPYSIRFLTACLMLAGCMKFGTVDQGVVVDFDREQGVVTLIRDSNPKHPANPRFDALPPAKVSIPKEPGEMGPVPDAGRLLEINDRQKQLVIFDASAQNLKTIPIEILELADRVGRGDARVAGKLFPVVDREKKTITVYSPRQRKLVTFSAPEECLAWPAATWRAGDEVRYYFKTPGQALRMMNVTKTDIFKASK